MPPPMRYPEKLLIRLPEGTRASIEALQTPGEGLAETQRRVIAVGIQTLSASPPAGVPEPARRQRGKRETSRHE